MKFKKIKGGIQQKAKSIKNEVGALYYAYRHKDTPILAKIVVVIVVGYAMSPVDLIPDIIPILGYLDDMLLLPLGIALAIKLVPSDVMKASRVKAEKYFMKDKKKNWIAFTVIILIWCMILYGVLRVVL